MPKKFLLSGEDIKGFRAVKRLHGALFSLGVAPLKGGTHAKCAFIVPKKVATQATVRNLVKRRARAAALPCMSSMPILALVFNARADAARASYEDIRVDITSLCEKAAGMAS